MTLKKSALTIQLMLTVLLFVCVNDDHKKEIRRHVSTDNKMWTEMPLVNTILNETGSKKRARWLQARRIFSPSCTNLRIPNRFLREGQFVPPARSGHRCVADSTNLYVFGGYNPDFEEAVGSENEDYPLFRELWRFNFATGTWQQVRTEGYMPTELASMSAIMHGNNLLVFGGTGIPFGENNGNDVHVCNVHYKRWNLLNCRGKKPNKIYGQAMIIVNGYLYVFGGTTGYLYSTDLHRLDLSTREWTPIKPNNSPSDLPEERGFYMWRL